MLSRWFSSLFQNKRPQKRRTARLNLLALEDRVTPVAAFALSGTNLLSFDTAAPAIVQTTALTGITAGETLVGIDFRPQNGLLYGLGVNATNDTFSVYAISTRTGFVTPVGGGNFQQLSGGTPVDLPDPAVVGYGFDFNPSADRIRVVVGSLNFRLDPNTGAAASPATPDGAINGGTTTVDATAYTNNLPNNGGATTQYTLDSISDSLFIQTPPNSGNQTLVQTVTLGGATLNFTAINGFDVSAAGTAFAILNVGGTTGLYSIDLANAQATLAGNVANGTTAIQGLAIQSDLGGFPAVAMDATGTNLLRFSTATPGTVTTQALNLTAVVTGETLVGIDFRPATGQLYGLGIDATTETGTLYLIDPQTGVVSLAVAGTASQITFTGEDFPDPATAGYGFDFNPDVDRIRVTTSTGLNFRVNPVTGLPAAATTDTDVNGLGVTGVSGTAYTNSFGNDTAVTATTQYTIDAVTNSLYVQNPPNNGTQTNALLVTVGGTALDFTDVNGFDIPAGVRVGTSNAAVASGRAFAVLTVGTTTSLYSIDLTTGAATNLGAVGAGATTLAGFTLADAPAGTVAFTATTGGGAENGGPITVNLTRTNGSNGPLTVTVNVTGGTAIAGTDFTAGPFTATFADGATTTSFTVTPIDDNFFEGNKTIVLTIAAVDNAGVISTPNVTTLTITDNETPQGFNVTDAQGYALGAAGTTLLPFSTTNPGADLAPIGITGITAGETLVAIDFRPQNGLLYGLGVNAIANTATLYLISPRTGVAAVVGTASSVAYVQADGTTPFDLPDATVGYDIDFNPAADRLRIVAGTFNARVDPNTGLPVDGNLGPTAQPGTNPDGPINGLTTNVTGTAYTNNFPNNGGVTTQYTLDPNSNNLFIQNPPNNGTQTTQVGVTLNGTALDFTAVKGFDILANVAVTASNAAAPAGSTGLAILTVGGSDVLYRINLVTGAATVVGTLDTPAATVRSLALQSDLGVQPIVTLSANGTQLIRATNPANLFPVTITGVNTGETLVGIDFRPATGQLYGLGINHTANTGTLYLLDPQTGTATAVGTPGQISFVVGGTPVDFPDPATVGYGFDFNPTVDRIRVTTGSSLNFRVNPVNGAPVDSDNNAGNGTTPDGNINSLPTGSPGVSATAYTNSFGTGGSPATPAGTTTQYTLDATSDSLFIQNPPNNGTQTARLPITLNGAALNFTEVNGFDIPSGVRAASNAPVPSGSGFAVLTVGTTTGLYRIDLTSGAATLVGNVGTGTTALAGLSLVDTPAGVVSFTSATFNAGEGNPTAAVTLTRTGGTNGALTVTVNATGGTATAGTDFTAGPFMATFADGATTATLFIPLINDTAVDANETIVLTIAAVDNLGVLGVQTTTTLTIIDNDVNPPAAGNVGAVGVGPTVTITRGTASTVVTPFPGFGGTVSTGLGDVNNDGTDDVLVGASISGHVKAFDGVTGAEIRSFFPFVNYFGGTYVAGGDVSGDGVDDIIIGATINGHVKVFDGVTGAEIRSFLAYVNFSGEARVGSGDINGDGRDDIITGAGSGAFGHVKVFSGVDNSELRSFLAYVNFNGGIFVAGGDVNGDGRDDIVTGAEANGHVKVFSGIDNSELQSFFAFPGFVGQARVAARDVNNNGAADLIVGTGPNGGGLIRTFDGLTLAQLSEMMVADPLNVGLFVA